MDTNFSTLIPTDVLNYFPYGISIQDKNRTVIFENSTIREWFGTYLGKKCYERWSFCKTKQNEPCTDCPGHVSFIDGESHFVIRKIETKNSSIRYMRISHYPIFKGDDQNYIEVLRDVTDEVLKTKERLELHYSWHSDIFLGFLEFNLSENDCIKSLKLPFLSQLSCISHFYKIQQLYWNIIFDKIELDQLIGPLPLIDVFDYNCFIYNFEFGSDNKIYTIVVIIPHYININSLKLKIANEIGLYVNSLKKTKDINQSINLEYLKFLICPLIA